MTCDEFEQWYAARSGIPLDYLHSQGIEAEPCDCGEPGCEGWAMTISRRPRVLREMICLGCGEKCYQGEPHTCPPLPPRPIGPTRVEILKPPTDKSPEGE